MTPVASTLDTELPLAADAVAGAARDAAVLLTCHIHPDGDALGSMLGFGLGLRSLGFTEVTASFPEPYQMAESFRFLPGLDLLVEPAAVIAKPETAKPELAVSFDAASPSRLAELLPACEAARTWLVVDHHASNDGFGSICLLDAHAAATAVVAAALLDRLGVVLDAAIATCLYTGLATDTGSFKFDTTTPEIFELAARLVRAGADPAGVSRHTLDTRSFAALRLLATVLGRAELEPAVADGKGLVWAYATEADLQRHAQPWHVLESFIDVIRTTGEADVACLFKPAGAGPDRWTVSLRSRGATDVGAIAARLGGGGHRLASGYLAAGAIAEVLADLRTQLAAGGTG